MFGKERISKILNHSSIPKNPPLEILPSIEDNLDLRNSVYYDLGKNSPTLKRNEIIELK